MEMTATASTTRSTALEGGRDVLPLLAGLVPFATVIGVAIHRTGVDAGASWAASILVCAGAAQLTAIELLGAGAAPLAIVATVVVINARFALFSAGLARWFETESLRRRLLLAFPLVDQLFLLCQRRFTDSDEPAERRAYYLGAAGTLVAGWSLTQAVALRFAGSIPDAELLRL